MRRPLDMYVQFFFFFPDLSAHVFQVPYFSPPSTLLSLLDHSLLSTNHTCKHFGYLMLFVQCSFCVSFFMANLEWILNWHLLKKILYILFFVLGSNPGFGWKICIKNCTVWTKLYKGFSRNLNLYSSLRIGHQCVICCRSHVHTSDQKKHRTAALAGKLWLFPWDSWHIDLMRRCLVLLLRPFKSTSWAVVPECGMDACDAVTALLFAFLLILGALGLGPNWSHICSLS